MQYVLLNRPDMLDYSGICVNGRNGPEYSMAQFHTQALYSTQKHHLFQILL